MKIERVETFLLQADVERPFTSARGWWYKKKTAMLVKITTDNGICGWGEAYGPAKVTKAIVNNILKDVIIGEDPFYIKTLWARMYSLVQDYGPRGMSIAAISAIDIALWDIIGKATNRPIYEMIGGAYRNEIPVYATGMYFYADGDPTETAIEEGLHLKELGYNRMKMKIGLGVDEDIARIKAVRREVGEEVKMMVDANHAYNVYNAILLGRVLEEMGVLWFEEPIPPHDLEGYAELCRRLNIPIAGGENGFTRFEFKEILKSRSLDIIQPDICCAGGITETVRIIDMADTWNVRVNPHVWGTAIGLAASVQILCSLPPSPYTWKGESPFLEYEQTYNPFRELLVTEPLLPKDGVMRAPNGPGLGIAVNEEAVTSFCRK